MVTAIIQARMGSSRLLGKVMNCLAGKPMLVHVVERVKHAKKVDRVIVATTVKKEDDAIEELAKQQKWHCFRGSAENVLERYYYAAKQYGASWDDIIVRVTSDCPLIDPEIIDGCIESFQKQECDYISNTALVKRVLPRGIDDIEVFSFIALEKAHTNATEDYEKEHVTPYIWENKKNELVIEKGPLLKNEWGRRYRLTVDYPEDFEVISAIYDALYQPEGHIKTEDAIAFLDKYPHIARINEHCVQKKVR